MKYKIHICLLLWSVFLHTVTLAVSIAYNFKIQEVTSELINMEDHNKHTIIALIYDQYQKKYNTNRQNFAGFFGAYVYAFDSYFFRTDVAVSHIHEQTMFSGTVYSGTMTDDIIFTLARIFTFKNKAQLTVAGLVGIPTHRVYTLQHVDFGTGLVGTGAEVEGSYPFNEKSTFLYGARYVHFFARNALDPLGKEHKFSIGNTGDLLAAYAYKKEKQGFEVGYTLQSQFAPYVRPFVASVIEENTVLTSSVYLVYKYNFSLRDTKNKVLANISYGSDHKPKRTGNKSIIALWATWEVSF